MVFDATNSISEPRIAKMTRTITNLWLDLVALALMVGLLLTGGIIHFVLPPGTGRSHLLFGLGRHDYGTIHFWGAVVSLGLLVLHLTMHWSYVCGVIAKSLGKEKLSARTQQMWGVGVLVITILLPILGIAWATSQVHVSKLPHRGCGHSEMIDASRH
jgi:hypothetical protein